MLSQQLQVWLNEKNINIDQVIQTFSKSLQLESGKSIETRKGTIINNTDGF